MTEQYNSEERLSMDKTRNDSGALVEPPAAESMESTDNRPVVVELSEEDIPGACLSEPLESQNVQALRRWLLCRGIRAPTTWKKSDLIKR